MQMVTARWRVSLLSSAVMTVLSGCGAPPDAIAPPATRPMRIESPPPAPKTAPIDPALLTDKFLEDLIAECRRKVERDLKAENTSPWDWTILDEYAPDSFHLMALRESDFDNTEKRVTEFRKGNSHGPFDLNLSFPVLKITDSFSGPKREVVSKACYLSEDFKILE
jgi:hypothetical protein